MNMIPITLYKFLINLGNYKHIALVEISNAVFLFYFLSASMFGNFNNSLFIHVLLFLPVYSFGNFSSLVHYPFFDELRYAPLLTINPEKGLVYPFCSTGWNVAIGMQMCHALQRG